MKKIALIYWILLATAFEGTLFAEVPSHSRQCPPDNLPCYEMRTHGEPIWPIAETKNVRFLLETVLEHSNPQKESKSIRNSHCSPGSFVSALNPWGGYEISHPLSFQTPPPFDDLTGVFAERAPPKG